jgi:YVTN family beta-propeller protein
MIRTILRSAALLMSAAPGLAMAQQAPWNAKDMPVSHRDRVYASEQFSNTVSVTDPADNRLLGVIKLGDPQPMNFSPLYKGQVLVHGLGFSPDGKTLAVVSIGSNAVSWIDTATNTVKHTTYVGRSPHEAFFTPDGKEVWVTVRGEDYIAVLDPTTYKETGRIKTPGGPGMTIFSPDGRYGYVCSSFNPVLAVFNVATHAQVGQVAQPSPFCPNIAATPDGKQVWFTLKDIGKTVAFDARPPFAILKVLDTGPITNHVNFARTAKGQFAYVTVGGENVVKVFRTSDFTPVATIPVGKMPHGVWPSGDGRRVYVGLENSDELAAIDTAGNTVVATVPVGQAPQAIAYVSNAVPTGPGTDNLQPLGTAGKAQHHPLRPGHHSGRAECRYRFAAQEALHARTDRQCGRQRRCRAACELHEQPGRCGDRQRIGSDPPDRSGQHRDTPALSGGCGGGERRAGAHRAGAARLRWTRLPPRSNR